MTSRLQQPVGEKANRRFFSHLGREVGIRSLSAPHLVAEMGLTINALPHTFVLSDKLLGVALQKNSTFCGCVFVRKSLY